MAAIHVITLSTSLLEFYYDNIGLEAVDDDDAKEEFKKLQSEIIKAKNRGYLNSQIRWVVDDEDTSTLIKEFAKEQNILNDL